MHEDDEVTVDHVRRTILVRGHRIGVSIRPGDGLQPPLVLCHGFGTSLEEVGPLGDAIRPGRTVIRFDPPGIGSSPVPLVPYSMASLAGDLATLIVQLGHDRADLLGFSWGGALVQQVALQHPGRCRRLVLASTMPGWLGIPGMLPVVSSPRVPRLPGGPLGAAGTIGYVYQLMALLGWTSTPWLPMVRQPTLILAGRSDPLVPVANARLMQGLMPHATLHLHDGGHLALTTAPHRLAPVIDRFLDRL